MMSSRRAGCLAIVAGMAAFAVPHGAARAQEECGARYTVEAGDTLAAIAERCGTTVDAIMDANARIEDAARISVGLELALPGGRASLGPESEVRQPVRGPAAVAALEAGTYEVRPGDSFASIATALQVPMHALMEANEGVAPFALRPGQTLRLPEGAEDASTGARSLTGQAPEPPALDDQPDGQGDGQAPPGGDALDGGAGADRPAAGQPSGRTAAEAAVGPSARPDEPDSEARAADSLMLEGRVLNGPECPVLETPEGALYSLVSAEYGFTPGDYVEIEGETVDLSFCLQGRATVRVTSMTAVRAPQGG